MRAFNYVRATTPSEACSVLMEHGDDARILAGGQSLLNMMKARIVSPSVLVDTHRITALKGVSSGTDDVCIGAMTTYSDIGVAVRKLPRYAILADAVLVIADMHVRHMGTMGGACCHADPFADMPNVANVLSAEFGTLTTTGGRRVAAKDFFVGPFETVLRPAELLSEIRLPALPAGTGTAYEKFSWRRGDYAVVSIAAVLILNEAGRCKACRLVAGALGPGPVELISAASVLADVVPSEMQIREAARAASAECKPEPDRLYGSAEYKRALVETLTQRAIRRALERARADIRGGD